MRIPNRIVDYRPKPALLPRNRTPTPVATADSTLGKLEKISNRISGTKPWATSRLGTSYRIEFARLFDPLIDPFNRRHGINLRNVRLSTQQAFASRTR